MPKQRTQTATATRARPSRKPARNDMELLTGKDLRRKGAQLINLIMAAANARGLSVEEAAREALGVHPSYLYSLRNGGKEIAQLGSDRIAKAAAFLGMSPVAVKLAAGQLKEEDFFADPSLLDHFLKPAIQFIQTDPEYAPFIPADIGAYDESVLRLIVMLYERATGRTLIPGRVSPEETVRRHRALPQGASGAGDKH